MNNTGEPHGEILGLLRPYLEVLPTVLSIPLHLDPLCRRIQNRLGIWKEIYSEVDFPVGQNSWKIFEEYFWNLFTTCNDSRIGV